MYVIDGACCGVSFIARGVGEQKYNPKQALRLRHCEERSDVAVSMLIRNSRVEISRITLKYAHKKSSAEAELNLKNKRSFFYLFTS